MRRQAERSSVPPDEYLAWEREQPTKHEYANGQVFAMAGASPRHNALCVRVAAALEAGLARQGCVTLSSDQRIGLRRKKYVYPDVTVVCGAIETEDGADDVIVNPTLVVEVLSASTEPHDRGEKWEAYRRIPSLRAYVLVSQSHLQLEVYERGEGGTWTYRACGAGEALRLASGACLEVDALYAGVMTLPGDPGPDQVP